MTRVPAPPSWRRAPAVGFAAAVLSALATGSFFAVEKRLLADTPVVVLNWMHMSMVLVFSAALWGLRRRRVRLQPLPYWPLLLFGLIACSIFYSRNFGLWATSPTTGAIITRTELAFVLLLAYLFVGERIAVGGWVGIVLLLVGSFRAMDISAGHLHWNFWGCAALMLAAMGTAANALIIKLKFEAVPNELVVLASALVQTVVWGILALLGGNFSPLLRLVHDPAYSALVVTGSVLVMVMLFSYYFAMKRIPMWSARMLSLLIVLVAIFWDVVWLHRPPTSVQLQGAALALLGAILVVIAGEARGRIAPRPEEPS